jgi:hypothetical protein
MSVYTPIRLNKNNFLGKPLRLACWQAGAGFSLQSFFRQKASKKYFHFNPFRSILLQTKYLQINLFKIKIYKNVI